ncbi:sulfate adenylyltransferase subunit CysN [Aliidiomarina minuta]|uniref:sulfate adenylyltransferase n=1 Tax=Aliidiomarina minuta TaxID=880057 RepID=A0A432W102_9GAMM|nr:sulfate adenylyltransferase subunit CysN [Aliidiomarina minuta]RUO22909.1 sulfate adenylyltransferase subunit CysN [Aliidiomarina minuta]
MAVTTTSLNKQLDNLGIQDYLKAHQQRSLLRVLTCGSVDDGKSTLIGRLLHDSQQLYDDQLDALNQDTKGRTSDGDLELAMLVDGLLAEREQGITIDVAYRYFSTQQRKFILADTPGHEQYTRNMVTGASNSEVAIVLVDGRHGVMAQTRRHSFICALLGIKSFIFAVNKMDLVAYDEQRFEQINHDIHELARTLELSDINVVPLSALKGENILHNSEQMPWYSREALLPLLENIEVAAKEDCNTRFVVQYVNRPHQDFRGYAGTLSSGQLSRGQSVTLYPSLQQSRIQDLYNAQGHCQQVFAREAITLTLEDNIDVSRGDWIVPGGDEVTVSNQLHATVVWFDENPLITEHWYKLKLGSQKVSARISRIVHTLDINDFSRHPSDQVSINDVAQLHIELSQPVPVDLASESAATGSFILIDPITNATVAAGLVNQISRERAEQPSTELSFVIELQQLIRKHFPQWKLEDVADVIRKT